MPRMRNHFTGSLGLTLAFGLMLISIAAAQTTPERASPPAEPQSDVAAILKRCRETVDKVTDHIKSDRLTVCKPGTVGPSPKPTSPPDPKFGQFERELKLEKLKTEELAEKLESEKNRSLGYVRDTENFIKQAVMLTAEGGGCSRIEVEFRGSDSYRVSGTVPDVNKTRAMLQQLTGVLKTIKITNELKGAASCGLAFGEYQIAVTGDGRLLAKAIRDVDAETLQKLLPEQDCESAGGRLLETAKNDAQKSEIKAGFWLKGRAAFGTACFHDSDGWQTLKPKDNRQRFLVVTPEG